MDERELDRAIDTAARELMAREPGRALSHNVMARVREGAVPAPRRFVWMAAAREPRAVRGDCDSR